MGERLRQLEKRCRFGQAAQILEEVHQEYLSLGVFASNTITR